MSVIGVIAKVVFLALLSFPAQAAADGELNTQELLVEEKLKLINKPALKSIQSEDGDIIDCVDIYKQPAFDHPLLKNHIIKMRPSDEDSFSRKKKKKKKRDVVFPSSSSSSTGRKIRGGEQTWRRSGRCPNGTVPILRVQKHHLLNSPTSIQNYGRKPSNNAAAADDDHRQFEIISNRTVVTSGIEGPHAYAVLVGSGYNFIGAQASIGIWNPWVQEDDEFSAGQIWLRNGQFNNSDSIELGWVVNPSVFGDKRVRFFLYWTADSGKTTGCFNLICPGFVQTSNEIALGGTFSGVSTFGAAQYEFFLRVWKDFQEEEKWWVKYNGITVGYWPAALFGGLGKAAALVLFGGDVYSPRIREKPHPTTAMGSGAFPSYHFGYAAFIRRPRIKDYAGVYRYPYPFGISATQRECYNAENYAEILWTEPLFYFGGPGWNSQCP